LTRATVTPLTVVIQTVEPGVPPNAGLFVGVGEKENRMARVASKILARRKGQAAALPFTKRNYQILGIGLLFIILGYVALSQQPWDGTMPLVVAPILLVLGYCVIIPLGILYREKAPKQPPEATTPAEPHV
jgi:hypothetical protein